MMNRRSPEVEEVRRGGFMSSQSQRWQRGGGEEHAAWIRRPGRGSGGWVPSGQPSLSSSSKHSFWRPVNAHAAAAVHHVQSLRATASTSSPHQTPNSDEQLKLENQAPPEEFEVAVSTPVKIDHKQHPLQHQVPQQQEPQARKDNVFSGQSSSVGPHILLSHATPSEETQCSIQHQQAVVPSLIQMPPGLPASIVSQSFDAPSIQQNQTEEMKLHKGMQMMMALPDPTPLQPKMPMLHKAHKKYVVAKLEQVKRRQLNAILNKLASENLHKLSRKVLEVNIDNVDTLSWFVSQILHRGLTEPTFCQIYAKLSSHLQGALTDFTVDHERITFRRLLLNKCQEEFERGLRNEVEAGKTEEDEALAHQTNEERSIPARRRMLGNTRFIGELYKNRSLTERIVHQCIITKLIGDSRTPDEGKIEALCQLMNGIGYMIDIRVNKRNMDAYFDTMEKLSTDAKLPLRVRFLLRDLIELRENKWHNGGEEEHVAWISRPGRSSSSDGWGPSGQPSLSSSSRRSFWRPVNAHAAAVQQFPATTSTSCHQTLTLDELKLKDQPGELGDGHIHRIADEDLLESCSEQSRFRSR